MAKKLLVFSGKGGVGKSSVTVCLARALQKMGKKVLLIDADIGFRSLDLIMRTGTGIVFNWLDIIEERCKNTAAVFSGNENEPCLITAPNDYSSSVTQESFGKMLSFFDKTYDYIFIDSPAGSGELHSVFESTCDGAILVATPDAVSVRSASVASERAYNTNPTLEMMLIINRFNKQEVLDSKQMKIDDVIDNTKVRLVGVIPEDDCIRLLPEGERITKYTADAFHRVAQRLNGESVVFNPKNFY